VSGKRIRQVHAKDIPEELMKELLRLKRRFPNRLIFACAWPDGLYTHGTAFSISKLNDAERKGARVFYIPKHG